MNWQKAIDKINQDKYKIPAGWDSKEKIAQELQCSPDRVHDLLKSGIASGAFESQEFPVWDAKRRLTVRIRCYRQRSDDAPKSVPINASPASLRYAPVEERVKLAIARNPDKSDHWIAHRVRGSNSKMVAAVRATL